jgi:hypothetical protein
MAAVEVAVELTVVIVVLAAKTAVAEADLTLTR